MPAGASATGKHALCHGDGARDSPGRGSAGSRGRNRGAEEGRGPAAEPSSALGPPAEPRDPPVLMQISTCLRCSPRAWPRPRAPRTREVGVSQARGAVRTPPTAKRPPDTNQVGSEPAFLFSARPRILRKEKGCGSGTPPHRGGHSPGLQRRSLRPAGRLRSRCGADSFAPGCCSRAPTVAHPRAELPAPGVALLPALEAPLPGGRSPCVHAGGAHLLPARASAGGASKSKHKPDRRPLPFPGCDERWLRGLISPRMRQPRVHTSVHPLGWAWLGRGHGPVSVCGGGKVLCSRVQRQP